MENKEVNQWISVCYGRKPKPGVIVETKIDDDSGIRNIQDLKFDGKMWWLPDGSMYVYYTPTHWRSKAPY